ncbi:Predicted lipocalin [Fructobacillus cardui]|uniref:hypothetical protein n=1 Tax=Fructobacillus cardui TaxID=2893170 RepID=UPI002DA1D871|nr:Predicted lipocalin [Fructobacillus cardui]
MVEKVRLADEEDFTKVGLQKNHIVPREDAERTNPEGENYKGWYFDANLDDGSQLVTTFYAKSVVNPSPGLKPAMEVEWTKSDGSAIKEKIEFKSEEFSTSQVRILVMSKWARTISRVICTTMKLVSLVKRFRLKFPLKHHTSLATKFGDLLW